MNIVVGTTKEESKTDKGDVLEKLTSDLLKCLSYEVKENLRVTGAELDLVCRSENNKSKEVYVECKAYGPKKKIDSGILQKMFGIRESEGYDEAWLVSTSELNKDAKAIVDRTENGEKKKFYSFITPEKFVSSLAKANMIKTSDIMTSDLKTLVTQDRKLKDPYLLFTSFGYFWVYEYAPHGEVSGYIFYDATSSELIDDAKLLNRIAKLQQLNQDLNYSCILELLSDDNSSRLNTKSMILNESYCKKINTMKFKLKDLGSSELTNDDVFVFPDLGVSDEKRSNTVDSHSILSISSLAVMYGDDLSGKTTLLQQYQLLQAGSKKIPILLNAEEIKVKTYDSFTKLLVKKFREQYSDTPEHESYINSVLLKRKNDILLLIDDLQNIGISKESSQFELMERIVKDFKNIIVSVHRSSELEFSTKSEWSKIFSEFTQYKILQFGHVKRDQIVEKWIGAYNKDTFDDQKTHNSKKDLAEKINIAVGKSFVPTHPFYLLTMLHLLEGNSSSTVRGTAYGELYTHLIINALGEAGAKVEDLDFYITYLSGLAHRLFDEDLTNIGLIELENFFKAHIDEMLIDKSYEQVHKLLLRARILIEKPEGYAFQFDYIRYYLVAKYLSDNFTDEKIKLKVKNLVTNLHKDKYANIVVFLIHHSKSEASDLVESILEESRKLFEDVETHKLSEVELSKFNALISEHVNPSYIESDPSKNRKEELAMRDKVEPDPKEQNEKLKDAMDLFDKITYSFRLMEVLGQIANNYYGSMNGSSKKDILNEVYSLGMRSMNALLLNYAEYIDGIKETVKQTIADKGEDSDNVDKIANDIIYQFTRMVVFAFIKKTSDSVMSKNLFPAIEKLDHPPEHLSNHLITAAIRLNFPEELSTAKNEILALSKRLDKNHLTKDVLKFLVIDHLHRNHVAHALKQSICDNLGINMNPNAAKILSAGEY